MIEAPRGRGDEAGPPGPPARTPSGFWFPFAHEIIRSGTWRGLSKRAKAVFPVICAFADFTTGECYPSLATIERLSGVGRSWVAKAIQELVEKGLILRRSGDPRHSNRYRVVPWGGAAAAPPQSHNGTPPGAAPAPGAVPERHSNYTQVTIANVNTSKNDYRRRRAGPPPDSPAAPGRPAGGGGGGNLDVMGLLTRELGLKEAGQRQLRDLIERYTAARVDEACEEAVAQGRPTLKYMAGILRNWEREGRVVRATRREADEERRRQDRREREEKARRAVRRAEVFEEAKSRLAECGAEELDGWRGAASAEADAVGLRGALKDAFVESKILLRVAEKYGIRGL